MFEPGVFSGTTTFQWETGSFPNNNTADPKFSGGKVTTNINLSKSNLGSVQAARLTLKGNTMVGTQGDNDTGNVYGGGDESSVSGNTTVILEDGAHVLGNVYGGGNNGTVGGKSSVEIK